MRLAFRLSIFAGLAMAGLAVIDPAFAQSDTTAQPKATGKATGAGWIVTLGGGTEYGPSYEGSRRDAFGFVPSFDIRRVGEPPSLDAPDDNIDFSLIELGGLELGPVAGIRGNRSVSETRGRLDGLHDIRWSVDAGAFAQYWPLVDRLRLRVEARQGLRQNDGFVADFGADVFQPVGSKFILSAGPRVSLADSVYMQNNFGVSATEAAANGKFAAYDAAGGFKSVGLLIGATYHFTDTMDIQVYDKFDRLIGDAADSPIVTGPGSANQNTVGIVFSRSFQINF